MFERQFNSHAIESLKLFNEKLKPDILKGVVFSAIRGDYIDFYYKGGRLFTFRNAFSTHKKYASVIKSKKDYISESDLHQDVQLIHNFIDGYEQIKENCSLYAGEEAKGVSDVYHKFSFVRQEAEIVVMDIEVSFEAQLEDKKQNRIDLLLFNKKTQQLRFYEAKHFSNSEIWSSVGTKPKVISQVGRYEAQIAREADNILKQYCSYVNIMNGLFGCNLPEPKEIDNKVVLLVFGFDKDQLQGRIQKLLFDDKSLEGIKHYFIGNISNVKIKNMWEKSNAANDSQGHKRNRGQLH